MAASSAPTPARAGTLPLVAMGLAVFVIANDVTAMSVALPAIEHDFDGDVAPPSGSSTPTP
jgi:hypothetical protein